MMLPRAHASIEKIGGEYLLTINCGGDLQRWLLAPGSPQRINRQTPHTDIGADGTMKLLE